MTIADNIECTAVKERAELTQRILSVAGFAATRVTGDGAGLERAFKVLEGIVAEYHDGGDQMAENCTCGEHSDDDSITTEATAMSSETITTIDLDSIAARLRAEGIDAYVEQTGGGCATIYAGTPVDDEKGDPRYPAVAGPGYFNGPGWTNARADLMALELHHAMHGVPRLVGDFSVGRDDDGEEKPTNYAWATFLRAQQPYEDAVVEVLLAYVRAATVEVTEGMRVELTHTVDRYPLFTAAAGALGTVTEVAEDHVSVKMDDHIDGCEEWDNEIFWMDEDDVAANAVRAMWRDVRLVVAS